LIDWLIRADVEEVQGIWTQVRQQLMETERLLTERMRAVVNGNDNFTPLSSILVLQQVRLRLKGGGPAMTAYVFVSWTPHEKQSQPY
jgi:hypothetical protein